MSRSVHRRVRFMLTFFIVMLMIPWNLAGASADDGTPQDLPSQVESTATTEVPVATDVPAEPTATDIPVEPTATTPATILPPETTVPQATETPEPEFSASIALSYVVVELLLCADDSRIGQADMQYYGGSFSSAGTSEQCHAAQGATVTLTGTNGTYVFNIGPGDFNGELSGEVQEGTYAVSYAPAGASTFPAGSFADQVVLTYDIANEGAAMIAMQLFVASVADPLPDGTGNLNGEFASCRDVDRAGESDFQVVNFSGASNADQCEFVPFEGQVSLTIEGTGSTVYGPETISIECCGNFYFYNLPFGTYTLTESIYGNESEPFSIGGVNGQYPTILVRNYFATEAEYELALDVLLHVCEDGTRDGEIDYFTVDFTNYAAASSCTVLNFYLPATLGITLFDSEGNPVFTGELIDDFSGLTIPDLQAGTYTVQLEGFAASQPFELANGTLMALDIFMYVDEDYDVFPPEAEGESNLQGAVAFCTSEDFAGEVQYVIQSDFEVASTGECVASTENSGVVHVYRFATSGATEPAETWTLPVIQGQFYSEINGGLPPGYYRIGYSPSAFSEPIELSSEFTMYDEGGANVIVYYFGAAVDTSLLQIRKDICYSDEKAGTTDFFFQQEDTGLFFATDETTQCRVATYLDGQYTYTLTDVETGNTVQSVSFIFPVALGYLTGVPAGTYTLTEEVGGLSRTSEPFEFDPSGGNYSVLVRNYVAGEMPPYQGEPQDGALIVWAYDCVNDAKAGTSEFYFNPGIIGTDPQLPGGEGKLAAASVENCVAAEQYAFELDDQLPSDAVGAAAVYPMIQGPTGQAHVHVSSLTGPTPSPMPSGSYVIRETTTGSVSEPIEINISVNIAAFYRFAAAPTPTPSPTSTPDPTATATATATIDPVVTPTVGDGTVEPGGDPDSDPDGNDPRATAPSGDPSDGDPSGGDGSVTTLPSTGQGQPQSWNGLLQVLLLAGLALILLAAGIRQNARRS